MSKLLDHEACRALGLEPNDERYTLAETKVWCLEKMHLKRYDLDVAACPESHLAPKWFGLQLDGGHLRRGAFIDGLTQRWWGDVWANIPFSNCRAWVEKAMLEWSLGHCRSISMLLPNDKTEQEFWHELIAPHRDRRGSPLRTFEMKGRTKFSAPGLNGQPMRTAVSFRGGHRTGSPFWGCYLLGWHRRFMKGTP